MTEIFKDPPSLSDWVDAKEWEESTKAEVLNLRDWTVCTNRVWQSEERAIDRLGGDVEVDKSDFLPVEFEVTVKFIVYQKAGIWWNLLSTLWCSLVHCSLLHLGWADPDVKLTLDWAPNFNSWLATERKKKGEALK